MMNTILENGWALLNTSLGSSSSRSPSSSLEVFSRNSYIDKDSYRNMAFTFPPSAVVEEYLGERGNNMDESTDFNDSLSKQFNNSILEQTSGNQSNQNPVMFGGNPNFGDEMVEEYIFDRSDVQAVFFVLYTIVFCCCFFGNLMVILVVTLHWRMRSITNFCLANLAFADLCVGIFCVYQNIVTYMMDSWVFGEFMCKMYHFINSLSTTASVLILVVICIERYLAIIHPMTCKQMLTLNRLRITIVLVWILSAAISSPRFYYFSTISIPISNNQYEIVCLPNRTKYNSKLMDMISMTVLFLIPLTIITILYTHIGIVLWKSSNNRMPVATPTPSVESSSSSDYYRETTDHNVIQTVNLTLLPVSTSTNRPGGHVGPSSPLPLFTGGVGGGGGGGTQVEKRSSFLPSQFICGNKSRKHKKHAKRHNHHCRAQQAPSLEGVGGGPRVCANCIRNIQMEGNLAAGVGVGGIGGVGLGTSGGTGGIVQNGGTGLVLGTGQEFIMNCKACQKPYMHQPHFPLQNSVETMETTSFMHHHHHHNSNDNGPSGNSANLIDSKNLRTRDEAVTSPMNTCCGGRIPRPTNICLRRQPSQDKSQVVFTTTPPSPYCTKTCPCLEENSSKTEPIVLVKFEKKDKRQSNKKNRNAKAQCTILMNTKSLSCHGTSPVGPGVGGVPSSCTGNRSRLCSQNGTSSLDGDTDNDSPRTLSPSPPRIGCAICDESGNVNLPSSDTSSRRIPNHHHHQHHHPSCHRNLSSLSDHKRNLSVDSGISATGRNNIEDPHQSLEGACLASCPSCGITCLESSNQLYRCPHHVNFASTALTTTTPSVPKRVRRMRITRSNKYGTSALQSRRRIIRMLIVVVLAFALCHLPFHARKVWQYWSPKWLPYQAGSIFSNLFTPITFLIMYANSAINPLLYAFMSKKFRMSFRDLLCCKMRHSLRISRNASVRSTHAVALSQAGL